MYLLFGHYVIFVLSEVVNFPAEGLDENGQKLLEGCKALIVWFMVIAKGRDGPHERHSEAEMGCQAGR